MRSILFILVLTGGICRIAAADGGWTLITADFKQQGVALDSLDAKGVKVTPVGTKESQTIGYGQFLQIDRPGGVRQGAGRFTLHMLSGDRLLGEPVAVVDEQIGWKSPLLGEMLVPLKEARALVKAGKVIENLDQQRTEDMVRMANGDSAKGIVTDVSAKAVKINSGGNEIELPLDAIDWIHFSTPARSGGADTQFRLRLTDGSVVTAGTVAMEGANLSFTLGLEKDKRQVALTSVAGIEQLNGPVSWLSSRGPAEVVQTPYIQKPFPTRMDASVLDEPSGAPRPITAGGVTYTHGIGVHSYSRIDYALDGKYAALRTQYAIAPDEKSKSADVTVRIKIDGKSVHEKEHVKLGAISPVVILDLPRDAKLLTLEVDYGAGFDYGDNFNWIEPALLREKPEPPPPPPPPPVPATRPATQPATQPAGLVPVTRPTTAPSTRSAP